MDLEVSIVSHSKKIFDWLIMESGFITMCQCLLAFAFFELDYEFHEASNCPLLC